MSEREIDEHTQEYGLQMYEHGRRSGYREAIEAAARVARDGCLVPPDGGAPTDSERLMCDAIEQSIRALLPKDAVSEGERK